MLLYHGTTGAVARQIFTEGLKPRTDRKGNWANAPSNRRCVYMTDAYALYFAQAAGDSFTRELGVIEIDTHELNKDKFLPDEDFLEQLTAGQSSHHKGLQGSVGSRTRWYSKRLHNYHRLWLESLSCLGTCAYAEVIPVKAVTRVAIINVEKSIKLLQLSDPSITLVNYQCMDTYYRKLTKFPFDQLQEDSTDLGRVFPSSKIPIDGIELLTRRIP